MSSDNAIGSDDVVVSVTVYLRVLEKSDSLRAPLVFQGNADVSAIQRRETT